MKERAFGQFEGRFIAGVVDGHARATSIGLRQTVYRQGEKTDVLKAKIVSNMTLRQIAFIATRRQKMAVVDQQSASAIGENKSDLDASVRYWAHAEKVMDRAAKIERKRESRR